MRILNILVTACGFISMAALADSDEGCSEIARFDEVNSRIFVVCPTVTEMSDPVIAQVIADIFARLEPVPDEYFISFFASVEFVGYKTDDELADHVSSGDWAGAYLGEYYTHSHEITLWPAMHDKRVVRKLPAL